MHDLVRAVAVAALLAVSSAHAIEPAPSLHPNEVAAIQKDARIGADNIIKQYGEKAGIKVGRISAAGMKCLLSHVAELVMLRHINRVTDPAQLTRWRQAAEFYRRKALKDCDSGGGPPNDGLVLIAVASRGEAGQKTNMNRVQDIWDDFKEAAGKAFSGQKLGPKEVLIIVGVGSLILLREMAPSPI